jgi:hypothetical protein
MIEGKWMVEIMEQMDFKVLHINLTHLEAKGVEVLQNSPSLRLFAISWSCSSSGA